MHAPNGKRRFYIEMISPRQDTPELDEALATWAGKYRKAIEAGHVVCCTDNPLGNLAFQGTELIRELGLPAPPGQVSIHLNTFHTRRHLDELLADAIALGIKELLVISGDGSERLPKLRGRDLGMEVESVTSVELIQFIQREYPGRFTIGVAFNPYEPQDHELDKMLRKLAAGATTITTQPIIEQHPALAAVQALGVPVVVEAWMSKKLHLLSDCVGYQIPEDTPYDPLANLRTLMRNYPTSEFYLSMVGFKNQFPLLAELGSDAP